LKTFDRPAGVANADRAGERLTREPRFEIAQLALGTPARKLPLSRVATPVES
jgi:hypothetical protein